MVKIPQIFGFENLHDLTDSTFHFAMKTEILTIGIWVGAIANFLEDILGIKTVVLFCFILLILVEFLTGLKLSIKNGNKISEHTLARMIIKIFLYSIIMGIMNTFSKYLGHVDVWGSEINIYRWLYYSTINIIILQLLLSTFKNLGKLGYAESSKLYTVIQRKFDKWLELDNNNQKQETQNESNN